MNRGDIGPLAKCSFEETTEMLTNAAIISEVDGDGVSASIMLGQVPPGGTGGVHLLDESALTVDGDGGIRGWGMDLFSPFEQFNSSGHGDWLKSHVDAPKVHIATGASAEAFDSTFESSVAAPPPSQAIVVRPAGSASSSALWVTEIRGDDSDDFSLHGGFDCRIAHSTERLVARSTVDSPRPASRLDASAAEAHRTADLHSMSSSPGPGRGRGRLPEGGSWCRRWRGS